MQQVSCSRVSFAALLLAVMATVAVAAPGKTLWTQQTNFSEPILSAKEYDGKYIAVISRSGNVEVFDLLTGRRIVDLSPTTPLQRPQLAFTAYGNGRLCLYTQQPTTYAVARPSSVVCADLTKGVQLFSFNTSANSDVPTAVDLSVVGRVAISVQEGRGVMQGLVLGNDGSPQLRVNGSMSVYNGVGFVAQPEGSAIVVSAYDIASLQRKWQVSNRVNGSPYRTDVACVWNGGFAVSWGTGGPYRQLSAFSTSNGQNLWHRQFLGDITQGNYGDCSAGVFFLGMNDAQAVEVVDVSNGNSKYTLTAQIATDILPLPKQGLVVVPTSNLLNLSHPLLFGSPIVEARDLATGSYRWKVNVPTVYLNANQAVVPQFSMLGANLAVVPNRIGYNFFDMPSGERVSSGALSEMRFSAIETGIAQGGVALKSGSTNTFLLWAVDADYKTPSVTVTEVSQ